MYCSYVTFVKITISTCFVSNENKFYFLISSKVIWNHACLSLFLSFFLLYISSKSSISRLYFLTINWYLNYLPESECCRKFCVFEKLIKELLDYLSLYFFIRVLVKSPLSIDIVEKTLWQKAQISPYLDKKNV